MVVSFLLKSKSKITYWNIKVRAERATTGERGCLHRTSVFPIPSPWDVNQNIPLAIWFFKKNANACAHTSVTLCTIKEWGKGNERVEKTIL